MKTTEKSSTNKTLIGAGIGLAALAAAGTYFLYGKRGAKNREAIAGWTLQLKGEVLEKLEKLKHVNRESFNEIVDETAERFARVKKVGSSDLGVITQDLKNAWTHIAKELK